VQSLRPVESRHGWQYFGQRYLPLDQFTQLCEAVALYGSREAELEAYERNRLLFPAARLVFPGEYARDVHLMEQGAITDLVIDEQHEAIHTLNWALKYPMSLPRPDSPLDQRHAIDRSWGSVQGLVRPSEEPFRPWAEYVVPMELGGNSYSVPTAAHYYAPWQIHQLYLVRRLHSNLYADSLQFRWPPRDSPERGEALLWSLLDAVSRYRWASNIRRHNLFADMVPNEDNWITLDTTLQRKLEDFAHHDAAESITFVGLPEVSAFQALRAAIELHLHYDRADHLSLGFALKLDLADGIELIHHAFGKPSDEVADRAGKAGGYTRNYLELLFPNRRQETRKRVERIIASLAEEHNKKGPVFAMSEVDVNAFLDYTEHTDLALFQYILVALNDAHFTLHSWQAAEEFLWLKSLASFPESLAKAAILNSGDATAITSYQSARNPGMGTLNKIAFEGSQKDVWDKYVAAAHREARTVGEFATNVAHLIGLVVTAGDEVTYLGSSLSLATLIRNFTSHLLVDEPTLLRGQYVRCVRAILSTTFLYWKVAQLKRWL
jgi:hypothetical protein